MSNNMLPFGERINNQNIIITVSVTFLLIAWGVVAEYTYYETMTSVLLTDEVCGGIEFVTEDYLPEGTLTEYYSKDTGNFSDYEAIQVVDYSRIWTHISISYTCSDEGEYIEYPLFYYKGYKAYDQDGCEMRLEEGMNNMVRVYIDKCDDVHTVNVYYKVNNLYRVGILVSIASALLLAVYVIRNKVVTEKA